MEFGFTPEQEQFRAEVKRFCREEIIPELLARAYRYATLPYQSEEIKEKLIRRGWYVPHWPKELGGQGLTPIELAILSEELGYGLTTLHGLLNIAENIRLHGTEEQKAFFLPRYAKGEISFTLGISEPNAGADAANIEVTADLEGDEWVINGQKMWGGSGMPGAMAGNWSWLVCRTDRSQPRHKGLSIIMTPSFAPGVTVRPIVCMGSDASLGDKEESVAAIHYDHVRVPKGMLLGEVNKGWYLLMTGLDVLRSAIASNYVGIARRVLDELVRYVQEVRDGNGRWITHSQVVKHKLAEHYCDVELIWNLAYHIASLETRGTDETLVPASHLASMLKIAAADALQRLSATGMQVMGYYGVLTRDEAERHTSMGDLVSWVARASRQISVGGGSSEMLRTQLAQRYLGLPR